MSDFEEECPTDEEYAGEDDDPFDEGGGDDEDPFGEDDAFGEDDDPFGGKRSVELKSISLCVYEIK